ncbi:Bax inhibitor-1 family protein [Macrococcus equi]|uniref:Bax inhibitor-1/YccA family protein n=1 Tax=Macrococcus equi TaxID=3395462 RepID=UPI0039BE300F
MNNYSYQSEHLSHSSAVRNAWLYFIYFWIVFAAGTFLGQFVPPGLRLMVSVLIFALVFISLFAKASRKFGFLISNALAFALGIVSYTSFMYYLGVLGQTVFYQNVALAVVAFFAFGAVGYFVVGDASNLGRLLFPALIALVLASFLGIFIHIPMFHLVITIAGLAIFFLYTIYDFNRLKRGQFSAQEMGFNLFINLLNIIMDVLRLASILRD